MRPEHLPNMAHETLGHACACFLRIPTSYLCLLLPTSHFLLPTSYFLLPTSYFLLPTSYFRLGTANEMLGRLCVDEGRNASIARAVSRK